MSFSQEDWFIIDETLNMVAKELEGILQEKKKSLRGNTNADTPSKSLFGNQSRVASIQSQSPASE